MPSTACQRLRDHTKLPVSAGSREDPDGRARETVVFILVRKVKLRERRKDTLGRMTLSPEQER